jgi:hypothetical protein
MAVLNASSLPMLSCCLLFGAASAAPLASPPLAYDVAEGLNINRFLRQDSVAAHLVLRSGNAPRVLVAFPAGNSGVGVWFDPVLGTPHWRTSGALHAVHRRDERGRPLYGITTDVSIEVSELQVRQAVLSSVRVLRDFQALGKLSAELKAAPAVDAAAHTISWSRQRLDGALSYRLVLEVIHGTLEDTRIHAASDGNVGLRITALSGEPPLTPLAGPSLLANAAAADSAARNALSFLAYREKLLAGSWRFDTYFGRDTLMSVRLLMPALSATAVESALSSVLSRLSPLGEVAHEEDIGERAVLDHLQADGSRSASPVFDYKMIDGNYLLAPIITAWLLEDVRARRLAADFLAAPVQSVGARNGTHGTALLDNLRLVLRSASRPASKSGNGVTAKQGSAAATIRSTSMRYWSPPPSRPRRGCTTASFWRAMKARRTRRCLRGRARWRAPGVRVRRGSSKSTSRTMWPPRQSSAMPIRCPCPRRVRWRHWGRTACVFTPWRWMPAASRFPS